MFSTVMRFALIAVILAVAAKAQPFVYDEVRSWEMESPAGIAAVPGAAVAVAADGGNLVIAWSAGTAQSRISIARLDGSLRVVDGAQRDLAPYFSGFDASDPQLVAIPSGYALLWLERTRSLTRQPVYVIVSRLSKALEVETTTVVNAVSGDAHVRLGADDDVVVAIGLARYAIGSNGSATWNALGGEVDDIVLTAKQVAFVTHVAVPPSSCGVAGCWVPGHYDAHVVIDSINRDTFSVPYGLPPTAFAINSDGSTAMVTWRSAAGEILGAREALPPRSFPESMTAPLRLGTSTEKVPVMSSASDGEQWIVVWSTQRSGTQSDIVGSVVDAGGATHPLTIASSSASEQRPIVVNVAKGVFLVAYEIADGFHRQLAGRYVTFSAPHHRPGAK